MEKKKQQQSYENYVRQKTPVHNLPVNMAKSIRYRRCHLCDRARHSEYLRESGTGQGYEWKLVFDASGASECSAYRMQSVSADRKSGGGAGALVPITGFANSVAAPAIEYKKRRTGYRNRVQDIYHCRTGDPVWGYLQAGCWTVLLAAKGGRSCRIICMEI